MTLSVALRHRFAGAAMDMRFEAPTPGVTMLFGPSGAGKSTVIAAAAGLLRPELCHIAVDGRVLADTEAGIWLPPERRRVGLVFQDARLFPHMSVATNLRYGQRRAPAGPIGFDDVVELLGIGALLERRPRTLSGGERQRVAIGRALLAQPLLLLMDEPLASLDAARKAEILPYLARLKTALRLPVLYVTHALEEMVRLADSVVLIEAGRVVAAGSLAEIAARGDLPLGLRDDAGAVFAARVAAHDTARRLTRLDAAGTPILVPLVANAIGTGVRVRVPAREVILAREAPVGISVQNVLPGTVRAITEDAPRHAALVEVMTGSRAVLARVTPDAVERLGLAPGAGVIVMFKSVGVEVTPE
ncbi:molybdenum ABC transporter ATP-binding protein [Limobrevibacterium gyesilva]|uniref:Molybdenum ABC transporter ATP-binding protein n=1 Tax=Limobrevibacterium gyesilva TaxID=2991712 RepID=A0AA42CI35_9PROT|nr:molybdenum ABC transporter ATP-binding protein [Limobrevibacterium gyesilva]MCW3475562.1 molybdenum ABC transporter ATP-binding protein [Limobrevibacterium gyesilva]